MTTDTNTKTDYLPVHREIVANLYKYRDNVDGSMDDLDVTIAEHGLPDIPAKSFPEQVLEHLPGDLVRAAWEYWEIQGIRHCSSGNVHERLHTVLKELQARFPLTPTEVHAPEYAPCDSCHGKGVVPCRDCDGEGEMFSDAWDYRTESHYTTDSTCEECEGEGSFECTECYGKGVCEL